MKCVKCGSEQPEGSKFCDSCGALLTEGSGFGGMEKTEKKGARLKINVIKLR